MKNIFLFPLGLATCLWSGCAGENTHITLDPVGPAKAPVVVTANHLGSLVVFSAYEVTADFNARDPNRPEYSDYTLYSADGKELKNVHNNDGTILQEPVAINLPPGKYNIEAKANGYGYVNIPVVIKDEQTTVLHLEGGDTWSGNETAVATNVVRLPDGRVIGWRAD